MLGQLYNRRSELSLSRPNCHFLFASTRPPEIRKILTYRILSLQSGPAWRHIMIRARQQNSKPVNIAYEFSAARLRLAIHRSQLALMYNQDQPRAPAGQSNGGRWVSGSETQTTDVDSGSESRKADVTRIINIAYRLRIAGKPAGFEECLNLCYSLLERKQPMGSDRNYWDFQKCMNHCLKTNN